jgi:phage recombination protein Bet
MTNAAASTALETWSAQDIKQYGLGPAEYEALRKTIAKEATPAEFRAHLMVVNRLGLSPVGGLAHFVKRQDQWTTQIGIDGYRSLAETTKLYQGPVRGYPQWQYEEGKEWTSELLPSKVPVAAKFAVWRKGWKDPVEAVAAYRQYVQTTTGGEVNRRWKQAPHPQLAKCAEALALRQAFPRKLGGIYTIEEAGAIEDVSISPDHQPGQDVTKEGLTVDQEAELKAINARLPRDRQWTLKKLKTELKVQGGDFAKVKAALEKEVQEAEVKQEGTAPETATPNAAQQEEPSPVKATVDGRPVQGTLVE